MKALLVLLLVAGCSSQFTNNTNTRPNEYSPKETNSINKCKPMIDCTNKSKSACAVAHYNAAVYYIQNGEKLIEKQLYLSAKIEFMQAVCRLEAAKILLKQAKLNNFQDYQIVIQFGLKERIKEKINFCDRRINFLRWKKQ